MIHTIKSHRKFLQQAFHCMYFSCPFLYNVPCCFYFAIRFYYKSKEVLLLSFFYKCSWDFTVFNMCFCYWIIAVLREGTETSFVFSRYFYSWYNSFILVIHTFVYNWKTGLEYFKKVHRYELNICLGSVSI